MERFLRGRCIQWKRVPRNLHVIYFCQLTYKSVTDSDVILKRQPVYVGKWKRSVFRDNIFLLPKSKFSKSRTVVVEAPKWDCLWLTHVGLALIIHGSFIQVQLAVNEKCGNTFWQSSMQTERTRSMYAHSQQRQDMIHVCYWILLVTEYFF